MTNIGTATAVLAKASLYDPTFSRPDPSIAVAWADVLGDIDAADALNVVATHYATETRRLMPADVIAGVKRIRAARLATHGNAEPDADGDDVNGYLAALRAYRKAIADGYDVPPPPRASIEGQKRVEQLVDRCAMPDDVRRAHTDALAEYRRKKAAEDAAIAELKAKRRLAIEAARDELDGSA